MNSCVAFLFCSLCCAIFAFTIFQCPNQFSGLAPVDYETDCTQDTKTSFNHFWSRRKCSDPWNQITVTFHRHCHHFFLSVLQKSILNFSFHSTECKTAHSISAFSSRYDKNEINCIWWWFYDRWRGARAHLVRNVHEAEAWSWNWKVSQFQEWIICFAKSSGQHPVQLLWLEVHTCRVALHREESQWFTLMAAALSSQCCCFVFFLSFHWTLSGAVYSLAHEFASASCFSCVWLFL